VPLSRDRADGGLDMHPSNYIRLGRGTRLSSILPLADHGKVDGSFRASVHLRRNGMPRLAGLNLSVKDLWPKRPLQFEVSGISGGGGASGRGSR
jgi:hypothetical protein